MNNTVAHRLRQARKERRLSQDDLATLCGISRQTIFEYEKGIYIPKLDNAGKLSIALGISLDYICFGIPSSKNYNLTYSNLMTSFLNLSNSPIFTLSFANNKLTITTSDKNFIEFYEKLSNIFKLEDTLSTDTYNKALNDIILNYNSEIKK